MTNTLGIMLEILTNYPWNRLSVRITLIGVIKRQFFDNNNLSQEIFAIDTWGALICSLEHAYDPSNYMETRLKADFLSSQKPLAAS